MCSLKPNLAPLQRFGELNPVKGIYEIPTKWQTSLGVSTQIGNIIGLQITGYAAERFGYRITMLVALICLTGFLFIQFFAVNLGMLLAGYLLLGVSLSGEESKPILHVIDIRRRFIVPLGVSHLIPLKDTP